MKFQKLNSQFPFKDLFTYVFLAVLIFIAVPRLSLVMASRDCFSLECTGFSLWWLLLLWLVDSIEHRLSSAGTQAQMLRGMWTRDGPLMDLLGQRWNLCPLHWQVDSQPLDHQRSPKYVLRWSFFSLNQLFSRMTCREKKGALPSPSFNPVKIIVDFKGQLLLISFSYLEW